jgi:hypothetical protein
MIARRSPMLLLAVGGTVFALIRWKRHPRVSLMTVIALVIYVIDAFVFSIFLYYLPDLIQTMRFTSKGIDWLYFFIFFIGDFVPALIIILLVAAAFSQRNSLPATSNA